MKPIKRGKSYRIEVRHKGKRYTKTFPTQAECYIWADSLIKSDYQTLTFKDVFYKYIQDVGKYKKASKTIKAYYNSLSTTFTLENLKLQEITPQRLTHWRNQRLKKVKPSTVNRQITMYSTVYNYAIKELFIIDTNPFTKIVKPSNPRPRCVRIYPETQEMILNALEYIDEITTTKHKVAIVFLMALHTAMRQGELLSLTWDNVYPRHVHLPDTKNGTARDVPLSRQAISLLDKLPKRSKTVFDINPQTFKTTWKRMLKSTQLAGKITFHDTRHEAISRMVSKGIPVEKVAKITGHKDIKTLINVYYNPTVDELADLLDF